MDKPDQRLLEADLLSADFRIGMAKEFWGLASPEIAELPEWPKRILWIAAAQRPQAPDRYYVRLDLAGYRTSPPTGTFWDAATNDKLALDKRPKGVRNSRFAMVFRTDWKNGDAFYHPYDREAGGHPEWPKTQPHLIWTSDRTIVDLLHELYALLQSGDYLGV